MNVVRQVVVTEKTANHAKVVIAVAAAALITKKAKSARVHLLHRVKLNRNNFRKALARAFFVLIVQRDFGGGLRILSLLQAVYFGKHLGRSLLPSVNRIL